MSDITEVDEQTYRGILDAVCPYCAARLPMMFEKTLADPVGKHCHTIPGTSHIYPCVAVNLRKNRGDWPK